MGAVTIASQAEVNTGDRCRRNPDTSFPRRHPGADRWVWSYFLHLRDDADLAARAAGGSLPAGAFSCARNTEQLPDLCRSVPRLHGADLAELQLTLRDLDAALAKRRA
jgi:hypothetical protein